MLPVPLFLLILVGWPCVLPAAAAVVPVGAGPKQELVARTAAVSAKPEDAVARYRLARTQLVLGLATEAAETLESCLLLEPAYAEAWAWLGAAYRECGRGEDARAACARALALDPGGEPAPTILAQLDGDAFVPATSRAQHLALRGADGFPLDGSQVRIRGSGKLDYTFAEVPADWYSSAGQWLVVNRWTCTPNWNWLGSTTEAAAALWNRHDLRGDQTVDASAAFRMIPGETGSYRGPSDLNLILCGDGRNLDSGYAFVVGGWNNRRTVIMKQGRVVAESRRPEHLLTRFHDQAWSTYNWHHKWWQLRAGKTGDCLQLYVDNSLACEWRDPEPLAGGQAAVWTYYSNTSWPRIQLYAQDIRAPRLTTPASVAAPPAPTPFPGTITADNYPGAQFDFEDGLDGWEPLALRDAAMVDLVQESGDGSVRALRITMANGGGRFGARAVGLTFDAVRQANLTFDYRLTPGAKLNLSFLCNQQPCEVVFSAPEYPSDAATRIGRITGVAADGKWHHAEFDLQAALRAVFPKADALAVTDVRFAVDTYRDYILAGFGGNSAGTTCELDNVRFGAAGRGAVREKFVPAVDAKPVRFRYLWNRLPVAAPVIETTTVPPGLVPTGDGDGFLHIQALRVDKRWSAVKHFRFTVDNCPPEAKLVAPVEPRAWAGEPVVVQCVDAGAGADLRAVEFGWNGRAVKTDSPGVRMDAATGLFRLDPAVLGMPSGPVPLTVTLSVRGIRDRLGNRLNQTRNWTLLFDRRRDHQAPPPPDIQLPVSPLTVDDFETGVGQWAMPAGAALVRDDLEHAGGAWSLRLTQLKSQGPFRATVRSQPFNGGLYRFFAFDYLVPGELRVDFLFDTVAGPRAVHFADNDGAPRIGEIGTLLRDAHWHHAEFDLCPMLRTGLPTARDCEIRSLAIGDSGVMGNVQFEQYYIDNFRVDPIQNGSNGLPVRLVATDVSGIAGYAYAVDTNPTTEPPAIVNVPIPRRAPAATVTAASAPTKGAPIAALPASVGSGQDWTATVPIREFAADTFWFHARARDGAGNWSATAHRRVTVDRALPVAQAGTPVAGAKACQSLLSLPLTDVGPAGVNPRSIVLDVNGAAYDLTNPGLTYDTVAGMLTLDVEKVAPQPLVFPNGSTVAVRLSKALDFTGNAVLNPPAWQYTMDYAQDKIVPSVRSLIAGAPHALLHNFTFEADTGQVDDAAAGAVLEVKPAEDGMPGAGRCVRAKVKVETPVTCRLLTTAVDAHQYPTLLFHYKLSPGTAVNLGLIHYGAEQLFLQFTGDATATRGKVEGAVADGNWHLAVVDLKSVVDARAAERKIAYGIVNGLFFKTPGEGKLKAGTVIDLDNVTLLMPGRGTGKATWIATDPSGIAACSSVLDQQANTVPPEKDGTATPAFDFKDVAKGLWFIHTRARDGAGNWGPASHVPFLVQ